MPSEDNPDDRFKNEWEKSLEAMGKYDDTLIDLRKYGFTIISALIGSEVFFGLALGIQNAILLTVATLVVVIYWLDLYYRNALSGALLRSVFLEVFHLEGALTFTISNMYAKTKSEYYIVVLYAGLFVTAVFIASALNTSTDENNSSTQVANSSTQSANASTQAANASTQAANASTQAANASTQAASSSNLVENTQVNNQLLKSTDFMEILSDIFNLKQPFILAILITGLLFIYIMYLTSRKRRRTFSRTMKLYDYCNVLVGECGSNITRDIQRVVMRTLLEKERKKYLIIPSMPIGYPAKKNLKVKSDKHVTPFVVDAANEISFPINLGIDGTLFLAERNPKWLKITENRPNHYWVLISATGILVLNTIGTFDRPFREEVFRLPEDDKETPDLEDQIQNKNIIPIHCDLIAQIYHEYLTSNEASKS